MTKFWIYLLPGLLLRLAATPSLIAQPSALRFDHISTEQGLSQSTVNAILEDDQGFIWFGTQDGLNRYDGERFIVFRTIPSDSSSIPDNYIWSLVKDRDGNIWIGTLNGGLSCYLTREERFMRYRHDPSNPASLGGNDVTSLVVDADGNLWAGLWGGGLDKFDKQGKRFVHFDPGNRSVRCLCQDRTGIIWIGTWGGLFAFDRGTGTFIRYQHDPRNVRSISGDQVMFVYEDPGGDLWVGAVEQGVNRLDRQTGQFRRFRHDPLDPRSIQSNSLMAACHDSRGCLWFGSPDAGVSRYDHETETFIRYRKKASDPETISSDRVYSLYMDLTGALWIGTADAGVNRCDPNKAEFAHFTMTPGDPGSLSHNSIRAICEDRKGDLWVGTTGGGLNRYRRKEHRFVHYRHSTRNPASISNDMVLAVYEDHCGGIWAGTQNGGLNLYSSRTGSFIHYRAGSGRSRRISGNSIMSIAEDRSGTLWAGTSEHGLNRYDRKRDTFVPFRTSDPSSAALASTNIWAIHEDLKGRLWLGTWGVGIAMYDPKTGHIGLFRHSEADPTSLSNNTVMSVYEDTAGGLWFGTAGGGLDMYRDGRFTHFTTTIGLPNDVVYGVLPDGRGNLWLSTNHGLSRFNPALLTFKNYDVIDGLQANEFNQGAYCRGRDGMLYFGGTNGFTAFHPDSIQANRHVPPIVLTGLRIFEQPAKLAGSLSAVGEISVSYRESFLSFEFAALDFAAPGKNQYAYRLEGVDRDWVYCGNRRFAPYTDLKGGTYLFRVIGSNNDGLWNMDGASVRLVVHPPVWETWWFRFFVAGLALALLYLFYRYRLVRLLELERVRTAIATDLHDDIGATLTGIALLSDQARREIHHDPAKSEELLVRTAETSRQLIDTMSDIVWAINPDNDLLEQTVSRMQEFAVRLLEAKGIDVSLSNEIDDASVRLPMAVRRNSFMVFKEMVNNLVRHSGASMATISFKAHKEGSRRDGIIIRVADNGRGFDETELHRVNGLKNMRARAEFMGGTLTIQTGAGAGTMVELVIPLKSHK